MFDKIVAVRWIDSRGPSTNWQFEQDKRPGVYLPLEIVSVGMLTREETEFIVISPSYTIDADGETQTSGDMTIPSVSIREIISLSAPSCSAEYINLNKRGSTNSENRSN